MRAPARILALAVLAAVAWPASAAADPAIPDLNLRESVHDLPTGPVVLGIDLSRAALPLEEESSAAGKITLRISADVLFDFGEADLTDTARRKIGELTPRLRASSDTVRVVGFTDSVGEPGPNLRLSRERADAVKAELVKHVEGVAVTADGRGEADPVAPNSENGKDNPAGRAENRRVEITFGV